MKYDVILLVAGSGSRMKAGKNKVFLELAERPIFAHSLELFLADEECQQVILVGKEAEKEHFLSYLSSRVSFVHGGAERQDSVRHGLERVTADIVMIHDGARPFVTKEELQRLKQEQNAILAVPVKDTIKLVVDNQIEQTIPREQLYQAQTPQLFESTCIKEVHEKAREIGFLGTDDASLLEGLSDKKVTIVAGSYLNIKITTPEDLLIGQAIISRGECPTGKEDENE